MHSYVSTYAHVIDPPPIKGGPQLVHRARHHPYSGRQVPATGGAKLGRPEMVAVNRCTCVWVEFVPDRVFHFYILYSLSLSLAHPVFLSRLRRAS